MQPIVRGSRYLRGVRFSLVTGVLLTSLATLACPMRQSSKVTAHQRERIDIIEDNLERITTSFKDLEWQYNAHLEDNHSVRHSKTPEYYSSTNPDKLFRRTARKLSPSKKLVQLELWAKDLIACFVSYQKKYGKHVEYFHEVTPKKFDVMYTEPPDTVSFEERVQFLESNMIKISNTFPRIKDEYNSHVIMFH
ncbi:hypothetical protein JXM67_09025 [candidate division WOR-3 bacterium]|nr:hypothetical protein [candidate division WOR-3 bacterium]